MRDNLTMRRGTVPKYPITQAWTDAVAKSLAERGWNHAELARQVRTSEATIHRILRAREGRFRESVWVAPISRVLSVRLPIGQNPDPRVFELIDAFASMDADDQAHFLAIARRLRKLADK